MVFKNILSPIDLYQTVTVYYVTKIIFSYLKGEKPSHHLLLGFLTLIALLFSFLNSHGPTFFRVSQVSHSLTILDFSVTSHCYLANIALRHLSFHLHNNIFVTDAKNRVCGENSGMRNFRLNTKIVHFSGKV